MIAIPYVRTCWKNKISKKDLVWVVFVSSLCFSINKLNAQFHFLCEYSNKPLPGDFQRYKHKIAVQFQLMQRKLLAIERSLAPNHMNLNRNHVDLHDDRMKPLIIHMLSPTTTPKSILFVQIYRPNRRSSMNPISMQWPMQLTICMDTMKCHAFEMWSLHSL